MSNLLVGDLAVVLQDVVVDGAGRDSDLLRDGLCTSCEFIKIVRPRLAGTTLWVGGTYQELGQVLIWNVGQLLAVEFWDNELLLSVSEQYEIGGSTRQTGGLNVQRDPC